MLTPLVTDKFLTPAPTVIALYKPEIVAVSTLVKLSAPPSIFERFTEAGPLRVNARSD